MNSKEILEKAITKAIDGGWDIFETENRQIEVFEVTYEQLEDEGSYYADAPHPGMFIDIRRNGYFSVEELIFNHDFAKALWGEEWPINQAFKRLGMPWWKENLQQMVLAPDPIKYLGENI